MLNVVFISYSHADIALAEKLENTLQGTGLVPWRDKKGIRHGDSFPDEIALAIQSCFAVVFLSSSSSNVSPWVQREVFYANELRKTIIPLCLDEKSVETMPPGLRLLFPHIHHAFLHEGESDQVIGSVIESLLQIREKIEQGPNSTNEAGESKLSALIQVPSKHLSPAPDQDWLGESDAVKKPLNLELLPITEDSPGVVGIVLDVSGSMQTAIHNDSGGESNRLEGVLKSIRNLVRRYHTQEKTAEVQSSLELIRLFAYGFGFADRAAKFGKLGPLFQRLSKDAPPVPSRVFRGGVRDLFELAGVEANTLSVKEIGEKWDALERELWGQRMDLFGSTQMRAAMETASTRFESEFARYDGLPHSALIIVSDGGDTKGDSPIEACKKIAERGTIISSCYLTSQDVVGQKQLYSQIQPNWPLGAQTLFRCSSVLDEDSALLTILQQKGWEARQGNRLFVQLNQSDLLTEFLSVIMSHQ